MNWHLNQIRFALGFGTIMSFYGIVAFIVWLVGDKFGYSNTQKFVIIGLVLITLPFALIIGFVSSRKKKKAEKKAAEEAEKAGEEAVAEAADKKSKPTETFLDLTKGTEETVEFLKKSNLGAGGKDAVYSLPWYLVMGTPKSGKSSLVLGSNLDFETLPSQRQSEQKFVRPTRNVDWRVTADAVFLDTAGRYQTEGVDEEEWSSLLETIKKNRANRPVDGLVLTVDTENILKSDEREIEEMAKVLRSRLDDVRERLKLRFPVYLVFTHADSIEGFRDSFSTSKQEGKNLVWGATIPLEKSDNAQSLFDGEFEILQDAIMKRRLMRLSAPFPPVRQLRIFNFPLHFGAARRKLGTFVTTLFRPNPFNESPFLRGFYFTAAPQNKIKTKPGQTMGNLPQTVGSTYFTEPFFRDVLLRDKDLVRTFQEQKQKPPIWSWLLTALGTVLVLALLAMVTVSLLSNKRMLDDAAEKGETVLTNVKAGTNRNTLEKNENETRSEITGLLNLHDILVRLDTYERESPPIYYRFGLYSGDRIYKEKLLPIFYNAVEKRFKDPALRRLEADLKKFSETQLNGTPEQQEKTLGENYEKLKAYLMLSGEYRNRAETTALVNNLKEYWIVDSKVPADLKPEAMELLEFWAKQVDRGTEEGSDGEPENFPRILLDEKLVRAARAKLQVYPAHARYYRRKVTEISKQIEDSLGETSAERMLSSNGGDTRYINSSYTIPGAYTLEGYKLMKTAISEANEKLSEDDWVLGEQNKKDIASADDAGKIETAYYRDYADQWKAFVKGLNIPPYTKENADEALQSFSSANSSIEILLKEIERNTNLSGKKKAATWWDYFSYDYWFGEKMDTGGNTQVEKEFRPLFTFVGDESKSDTPLAKYRGFLGKVSSKFSGFSQNEIIQISKDLAQDNDKQFPQLRKAEGDIKQQVQMFGETPSGLEIANFLQEPLDNLRTLLSADAKGQLERTWTNELLPVAKEIQNGFPFEDGQNEAKLNKITEFLNPSNGKLTEFYNNRLKIYFEEKDGQLLVKENSPVKFDEAFVSYLNNAFKLRKALFGESNATPKFEYEFKLDKVADAIIEITIDGTKITSEESGSAKLTFPASSGQNGVFMNFESTSGTTTTSGSSFPTTSGNSNTTAAPPSNFQSNSNSGGSGTKEWQGEWGLFRFFDAGSPSKQPTGEYNLSYTLGGKAVKASIRPLGDDLFDKSIFRNLKTPENLLKK